MYKCSECDKRYTKQTSLNRHVQNHQRQKRYTCEACQVSFYRRDLLSRHNRIHSSSSSVLVDSPSLQQECLEHGQRSLQIRDSELQGRQRCHTACIPCRDSRMRCDGSQPCQRCAAREKTCEYSRAGARVSHAAHNNPSPAESEVQQTGQVFLSDLGGSQHNTQSEICHNQATNFDYLSLDGIHGTIHERNIANISTSKSPGIFDQDEDTMSNTVLEVAQNSEQNFVPQHSETEGSYSNNTLIEDIVSDLISDTTAWPWLHESMFLQPESQVFWPEISDTHGSRVFMDQDLDENTQDETARALLLMSGDPHFVHAAEHRLPTDSNSATQKVSSQLQGEAARVYQETRSATGIPGRLHSENVRKSTSHSPRRSHLVDELVSQATLPGWIPDEKAKRAEYWRSSSTNISDAFFLREELNSSSIPCLPHFLDLYLQHFHPLWPLLSRQSLDIDVIHPVLYLTLVSIGAMYGGLHSAHFGTQLHGQVRKALVAGVDFGEFDNDLMWLCLSRLLTQVAALYFGQPRAFSYAQHLGGILVAQARRMNLFTTPRTQSEILGTSVKRSPSERLARWIYLEERRRLAFGILRVETYTSVLLNTRPLLSPEEIDLELPDADSTWRGPRLSPEIFLAIVEQERAAVPRQRFSDIVRVALERSEKSCLLELYGHELLLFGLQQSVWRFSHDPNIFKRLTVTVEDFCAHRDYDGLDHLSHVPESILDIENNQAVELEFVGMTEDHLGASPRHMADLKSDLNRLIYALREWKQSLQLLRSSMHLRQDRNTILSSLLLYHLSYLRLKTPLDDMHHISYRTADNVVVEKNIIAGVRSWASSRDASIAGQHACIIWQLMCRELQRAEESRAKFNFLAFAGLHHAAVVLWTLAGTNTDVRQESLVIEPLVPSDSKLAVHRGNSCAILVLFSKGFDHVTPGRWSSFSAAALKLSACQFPMA